ncbi:K02A2.6-like [Cordylochernes scorpioides]|uniref:K02A2.6-like n=1 Tax=Cordylochernes scorpioides TaxID=51811 RepID=A0ABY6LTI6_9ARAC|nr:K02A2.6-like [Cordylochernes scorpioides]
MELKKQHGQASRLVVHGSLGNRRDDNYKELVQNMLKSYKASGVNMSIKVHYLHSHLDKFPDNIGAYEHLAFPGGRVPSGLTKAENGRLKKSFEVYFRENEHFKEKETCGREKTDIHQTGKNVASMYDELEKGIRRLKSLKIEAKTIWDSYPLPRIDATLDILSRSQWFSTLDLKSGYWQVSIQPEDREKTAFTARNGLWQFKVMPFGLCNVPATLERLMETVLQGIPLETCLVYLDDIIVMGKSFEEHLINLERVPQKIRGERLKLNSRKCQLFKEKVRYLGHACAAIIEDFSGVFKHRETFASTNGVWPPLQLDC